jgi:hypothetical protein
MEIVITNQVEFDNRLKLPEHIKTQWLEALRSGKYKQGKEWLKIKKGDEWWHCCLGVLCEIREVEQEVRERTTSFCGNASLLSNEELTSYLGCNGRFKGFKVVGENEKTYYSLAGLNDAGFSFEGIANVIEKYF